MGHFRSENLRDRTTEMKFSQCLSSPLSEGLTLGLLTLFLLLRSSITSHPPLSKTSVALLPMYAIPWSRPYEPLSIPSA